MEVVELQEHIRLALRHGDSLDEIEKQTIKPAPLHGEQKAALWLFAAAVANARPRPPAVQLKWAEHGAARSARTES